MEIIEIQIIFDKINNGIPRRDIIWEHYSYFEPRIQKYLEGKPGKSKADEDIMVNWLIRKFKSKHQHKTFITDGHKHTNTISYIPV